MSCGAVAIGPPISEHCGSLVLRGEPLRDNVQLGLLTDDPAFNMRRRDPTASLELTRRCNARRKADFSRGATAVYDSG